MTDVYVVRNQLGHYWGKAKTWVDGSTPREVLRTKFQDEAINTLFELETSQIPLPIDPAQEAEEEPGTEPEAPASA